MNLNNNGLALIIKNKIINEYRYNSLQPTKQIQLLKNQINLKIKVII